MKTSKDGVAFKSYEHAPNEGPPLPPTLKELPSSLSLLRSTSYGGRAELRRTRRRTGVGVAGLRRTANHSPKNPITAALLQIIATADRTPQCRSRCPASLGSRDKREPYAIESANNTEVGVLSAAGQEKLPTKRTHKKAPASCRGFGKMFVASVGLALAAADLCALALAAAYLCALASAAQHHPSEPEHPSKQRVA